VYSPSVHGKSVSSRRKSEAASRSCTVARGRSSRKDPSRTPCSSTAAYALTIRFQVELPVLRLVEAFDLALPFCACAVSRQQDEPELAYSIQVGTIRDLLGLRHDAGKCRGCRHAAQSGVVVYWGNGEDG
jgi:hypothetical protein